MRVAAEQGKTASVLRSAKQSWPFAQAATAIVAVAILGNFHPERADKTKRASPGNNPAGLKNPRRVGSISNPQRDLQPWSPAKYFSISYLHAAVATAEEEYLVQGPK